LKMNKEQTVTRGKIKRLQKKCNCCFKILSIEKFNKNKSSSDGHAYQCIECKKYQEKKYGWCKKRNRKRIIENLVKNEVTESRTKINKSLWNGIGYWSRKYPEIDKCLECNTNVYKHQARGVCSHCYKKLHQEVRPRRILNPEEKQRKKEYDKNRYSLSKKVMRDVLYGNVEKTDKIKNLVNNYKELLEN